MEIGVSFKLALSFFIKAGVHSYKAEAYRMVSASITFHFANTNRDKICLANSEHFRKVQLSLQMCLSGVLFRSSYSMYCLKNNINVNLCSL